MDILALKRDMAAIDGGKWITGKELPDLKDARLRVKGYSSRSVQDAHAARLRALVGDALKDGKPTPETSERLGLLLLQDVLVDAEGFTANGEALTAAAIREAILDPAFDPLTKLILRASMLVDAARVARDDELRGNS